MNNKDRLEKQMEGRVWRMNSAGEYVCSKEMIKVTQEKTSKKGEDLETPINAIELDGLIAKLEEQNQKRFFDMAIDQALIEKDEKRFKQLMNQLWN